VFRFEKLAVWERAVDHADHVYFQTRAFPDDERFGLTSQMRRAAVSISSNVAEGRGRRTDKDFARFVEFGYSSLMETVSESHMALRQSFLQPAAFRSLYDEADELPRMLGGLRSSMFRQ